MSSLRTLTLDLEFGRDGRFHALAASLDGRELVVEERRPDLRRAHDQVLALLSDGPPPILTGHNLHRFDRAKIAEHLPDSPLLRLPTLDTLELSAIAFPQRPYHRIVKDERLVRDTKPAPLSDVRACQNVLADAIAALLALTPDEVAPLSALLRRVEVEPHARAGLDALIHHLRWAVSPSGPQGLPDPTAAPAGPSARPAAYEIPDAARTAAAASQHTAPVDLDLTGSWSDRACRNSPWMRPSRVPRALLYVGAWLRAARTLDGSALPAWVRRSAPEAVAIARSLRGERCTDPGCAWCAQAHSPERWLHEVFGFEGFRDEPRAPDGSSLQRALVERGLCGAPTFGILPTGGGKSLCFQVPAEARYRLLGQLTIVISPLQSLMKDQVDALRDRIPHARAIYGGLPALLRPLVVDDVRSGACGLLYLSPEQFRNPGVLRLLMQRDLGAIVFDEAHCLSQWGHDFRTDYPYVLKALREQLDAIGLPMPPVFLFTATSQRDATAQILAHVEERTGSRPVLLDGGSERKNLTYEVHEVPEGQRVDATAALLQEHLRGGGAAIVFCRTRKRTERTAEALNDIGWPARAYHAGLSGEDRRTLQDDFLDGRIRVITATNAFGMGVDKADVRLVVHLDMPASLESYLQEAGRAGRDRKPAAAVLLWSAGDADGCFALGARGDLGSKELSALWRAIDQLPAIPGPVSGASSRLITPRELLFQEALAGLFDPYDASEETRVKAGVNWLERAEVLARRENQTLVFTGRPTVRDVKEGQARMAALRVPDGARATWSTILEALLDRQDDGLSADEVAVLCRLLSYDDPIEGGHKVLDALQQMHRAGLVTAGQTFAAFVDTGVQDSSLARLKLWIAREEYLITELADHVDGARERTDLGYIASMMAARDDQPCRAERVAALLRTWSHVGAGQRGETPKTTLTVGRDHIARMRVDGDFRRVREQLRVRHQVANRVVGTLVEAAEGRGKKLHVSAELEQLLEPVERDLFMASKLTHPAEAARAAIAFANDLAVIEVVNGLAVFRAAMRLDREPGAPTLSDEVARRALRALSEHRAHKILRVHVMDAWARAMRADPERADALRRDWFALPIGAFKERWLAGRDEELARPTTPESYARIVTDLRDPRQQAIVTADPRRSHLILAGPGSGKTRVLVHRVAWLLRCRRVRGEHIAVLCYTRANSLELRRRLRDLVGRDAARVRVSTLHGLALRLVGPAGLGEGGDFDGLIARATRMLTGEALDEDQRARQRDAMLQGVQYLFVDEYQDIDEPSYDLLVALSGSRLGRDAPRLRVFAVGDDDQAIYAFRGGSIDFIRRYKQDYNAVEHPLVASYRCPAGLLDLAQDLIGDLPGRLKAEARLTVNPARRREPPLGSWTTDDPVLCGRIPWHRAPSMLAAAHRAIEVADGMIARGVAPTSIGILARSRAGLSAIRLAAEAANLPFSWPLPEDGALPIARIREVTRIADRLDEATERVRRTELMQWIEELGVTPWADALRTWLQDEHAGARDPGRWRSDLALWARLERRARRVGEGLHLSTMHGAKGLEFDHVLLLDDGRHPAKDEEIRLLYVAITRARRSLQLFSTMSPSPPFALLRSPLFEAVEVAELAAELGDRDYGVLGRADVWIDGLGRRPSSDPGHAAMVHARPGDPFSLRRAGASVEILDGAGVVVGYLSAKGRETWGPRMDRALRLKLLATTREHADDDGRDEPYRAKLQVDRWWTGVWEARWRR